MENTAQPLRQIWPRRRLATLLVLACLAFAAMAFRWSFLRVSFEQYDTVYQQRVDLVSQKVDPNTATIASLRRLPQIGQTRAEAIVEYRSASSHKPFPFTRPADLDAVKGLGPGLIEQFKQYLQFPAAGETAVSRLQATGAMTRNSHP